MATPPPREMILSRAGELFHKYGYSGVSLEQILGASGLSPAEFHRNYSDKSALGKAWLERLAKMSQHTQEAFLERPGERDRRLRRFFTTMQGWVEANDYRACQFANTAASINPETEPELADLIDQFKRRQRRFFIELVGSVVGPDSAQGLGTAVFLLFSGAMTEAQNLKAGWPFEDALAAAERLCGVATPT